jgi:hypothetical protein
MHTKRMMTFAAVLCVFAMLAYLFVFAEATVVDVEAPDTTPAANQ